MLCLVLLFLYYKSLKMCFLKIYIPSRLPHLRGIEHHIDLVPRAMIPNQLHIEVIPRRQRSFKGKLMSL